MGEGVAQIRPQILHLVQDRHFPGHALLITGIDGIVESAQGVGRGSGAASLHLFQQIGSAQDLPADHDRGEVWKVVLQCLHICGGMNLAVVAQWDMQGLTGCGKGISVGCSGVLLPGEPGMDDELVQGISGKDIQQPGPLVGILHADAGFDGDAHRAATENLVQKSIQLVRYAKETGAPFPGGDGSRGATQIQVHRVVAVIGKLGGNGQKVLRAVGEDLGDEAETLVVFRQDLVNLPAAQPGIGKKGCEVFVRAPIAASPGVSKNIGGKPLHGGKVVFHGDSPLVLKSLLYYTENSMRKQCTFFYCRRGWPAWGLLQFLTVFFQQADHRVEPHGDDAQDDDGQDDPVQLEHLAAVNDEVSQPLSGTDEFPDDDAHQRQTDVDLGGGEEDGDVGGEDDAAQNIQSAAAQGADQLLHVGIHLPETGV